MNIQRIAISLTIINLLIMSILLSKMNPVRAEGKQPKLLPVLRASAFELVDSLGRVRASIKIEPPVVVDGKQYAETVILRLIDNKMRPQVKLQAGANGAGFSLASENDGHIQLFAHNTGSIIRLTNNDGKVQELKP
jgi:hypothetical protein